LGMNDVVVREVIKNENKANVIMGTSLYLQILGRLFASVLVTITIYVLRPNDWAVLFAVLVMLPSVLLRSSDIFKDWFESKIKSK
ncbi:flippase, partial [Escherichia coli]|nr:flippase [Escherichia coli]